MKICKKCISLCWSNINISEKVRVIRLDVNTQEKKNLLSSLKAPHLPQYSTVFGWFASELNSTWRSAHFWGYFVMFLELGGICKHSLQPSRFIFKAIETGVPWSHRVWLITSWVTSLCWESSGGQTRGVSVRSQGSNQNIALSRPCADIHMSSVYSDMASFPSHLLMIDFRII